MKRWVGVYIRCHQGLSDRQDAALVNESSSDEISEGRLLMDCGVFSIIRGGWFDLLSLLDFGEEVCTN